MLKKGMLPLLAAVIAGFAGGLLSGHLPSAQAKNQVDIQADSLTARIVRPDRAGAVSDGYPGQG